MYERIPGFSNLETAYHLAEKNSIGLYLGAGVNLLPTEWWTTRKRRYATYTWEELLRALYEKNREQLTATFEELLDQCRDKEGNADWADLASKLVGQLSIPEFVGQIDDIIYGCIPRGDRYGRLSKVLLDQAPTLHATICFSAEIKERTDNSWTFRRNRKVGMVITPNYDFFFGAGWTRYQTFKEHWSIRTPPSSRKGETRADKGTVNYIHGYVPYTSFMLLRRSDLKDAASLARKLKKQDDPLSEYLRGQFSDRGRSLLEKYDGTEPAPKSLRKALVKGLNNAIGQKDLYNKQRFKGVAINDATQAMIRQNRQDEKSIPRLNRALLDDAFPDEIEEYQKDLVLKKEQYERRYAQGGFALEKLEEAVGRYKLIFLGTSFEDKPLRDMLGKYRDKQHFAVVKSGSEAAQRAKRLGVCTVEVKYYSDIAGVLEKVYCAELARNTEECQKVDPSTPKAYWERLMKGPTKTSEKKKGVR
jgi:hypothetical protein